MIKSSGARKAGSQSVSLHLPSDAVEALFDREKFSQALTNVLSNAFKYSPEGGSVLITAETRSLQHEQQVGVRVQDSGIGMSDAVKERLFERFFRADASGSIPGTGLGMSLVKEIMDLHRGEIEVDSTVGEGTTVTLWIPRAAALSEVKMS